MKKETYRFRYKFIISKEGLIKGEQLEESFLLTDNHDAIIKSVESQPFERSTKFIISAGNYHTAELALNSAIKVKLATILYGAKNQIGIDAGKDISTGSFSSYVKEKVLKENGINIINDVHGIQVYSELHPVQVVSFHGTALINPRPIDYFLNEIKDYLKHEIDINRKYLLAIDLLSISKFEKTINAKFLSLIMGVESILEFDYRNDDERSLIDKLHEIVTNSNICLESKKSILGSLKWLYKDSISSALKKQALKNFGNELIGNEDAVKFIKKCYNARSNLVHNGFIDKDKFNLGFLCANLEEYLRVVILKNVFNKCTVLVFT